MNTSIAAIHPEVTGFTLGFAMDMVSDELDKLHYLAIALTNQLEPEDPKNPTDDDDVIAWRLAQVLEEKLGGVEFMDTLRGLLRLRVDSQST